jgi:Virulence factor BrkB
VLWLVASACSPYTPPNFSHYNKIYGSLAGVIIFLIWMWISNVAILLGAEFNAELERGRAMAAGIRPTKSLSRNCETTASCERKRRKTVAELRGKLAGGRPSRVSLLPTSARKVDDLVKALGADSGISRRQVSQICAELAERRAERWSEAPVRTPSGKSARCRAQRYQLPRLYGARSP